VVKSLVEALQQIGSNGIFQDQIAVEIKEEIIKRRRNAWLHKTNLPDD